jgi:hypothetical protein
MFTPDLLRSAALWAAQEMGRVQLGDRRRTRRLVRVTTTLAQNPNGTLPTTFTDWRDLRAAYRLFAERDVTHDAIAAPHFGRVAQACQVPGKYLLVEDTTTLSFNTHAATADLGPVNDQGGKGFLVHNTLALRVAGWDCDQVPTVTVLGLAGQHCWSRPKVALKRKQKAKAGRLGRQRESARWAASLQAWPPAPARVQWIYVADRESDIYEVFERCAARGADWVIRAAQARALLAEDRSVFAAVAQAPVRGDLSVELRARPGQPARTMRMALRAGTVTLRGPWRPGGQLAPRTLQVVEVREVAPPAGTQPMVWVLLTSLPSAPWPKSNGSSAATPNAGWSRNFIRPSRVARKWRPANWRRAARSKRCARSSRWWRCACWRPSCMRALFPTSPCGRANLLRN